MGSPFRLCETVLWDLPSDAESHVYWESLRSHHAALKRMSVYFSVILSVLETIKSLALPPRPFFILSSTHPSQHYHISNDCTPSCASAAFTAKLNTGFCSFLSPDQMYLNRNVSDRQDFVLDVESGPFFKGNFVNGSFYPPSFPLLPCECNHRDFILISVYLITILASALPASVALLRASCSSGKHWCV